MIKLIMKGLSGASFSMVLAVGVSFAAIEPVPEELEGFIQSFFQKLAAGGADAAVQLVESRMANPDKSPVKRQSLVLDLSNVEKLFGKHVGLERLYSEYRGKDLLEIRVLYKCEDAPLIFYFNFYRSKAVWLLDMIYWDRKPEGLFDDD